MADEDTPLTHGRDLNAFLNRYGIVRPDRATALEIMKGVRLGVEVDDVSHLVPPITVPVAAYNFVRGAVALVYSAVRITFGGKGGYLVAALARSANAIGFDDSCTGIAGWSLAGTIDPGYLGGNAEAPLHVVEYGDLTGIPASTNRFIFQNATWATAFPMYFSAGRQVYFCSNAVNTALVCNGLIQDVP